MMDQSMKYRTEDIPIKKLLLDPNNYRFLDESKFKKKAAHKSHVDSVQEATLSRLERGPHQLDDLKGSILKNGYVPMERIVVTPYSFKSGFFIVVEGNRRVAALKSLLKEHSEGSLELTAAQVNNFSHVPAAVLLAKGDQLRHLERVIMGIRHIAGPRQWGAYQQALLVSELKDIENLEFSDIGEALGISAVEAARRYRAVRALQQMEKDELYAKRADKSFYRLFHELVASPGPRERFGWSSEENTFTDAEKAREFYSLIAPQDASDPRISTFSDVRKLKVIVGHKKAEAALFDPDKTFEDSLKLVESAQEKVTLGEIASEVIQLASGISATDLQQTKQKEIRLLDKAIQQLRLLKSLAEKSAEE